MNIAYRFTYQNGRTQEIIVDVDRSAAPALAGDALPEWTLLGRQQCANCPLRAEDHPRCPAAVDLAPTMQAFAEVVSHREARVEVTTPERTVTRRCQVQNALSSLVALVMATSACPILGRMRGLARTHLPFATMEETLLRSVGAYLIKQVHVQKQGGAPDWSLTGLRAYYAELETVNRAFKRRVEGALVQDAALNAVSALGVLSVAVAFSLEDHVAELAPYAAPSDSL